MDTIDFSNITTNQNVITIIKSHKNYEKLQAKSDTASLVFFQETFIVTTDILEDVGIDIASILKPLFAEKFSAIENFFKPQIKKWEDFSETMPVYEKDELRSIWFGVDAEDDTFAFEELDRLVEYYINSTDEFIITASSTSIGDDTIYYRFEGTEDGFRDLEQLDIDSISAVNINMELSTIGCFKEGSSTKEKFVDKTIETIKNYL